MTVLHLLDTTCRTGTLCSSTCTRASRRSVKRTKSTLVVRRIVGSCLRISLRRHHELSGRRWRHVCLAIHLPVRMVVSIMGKEKRLRLNLANSIIVLFAFPCSVWRKRSRCLLRSHDASVCQSLMHVVIHRTPKW